MPTARLPQTKAGPAKNMGVATSAIAEPVPSGPTGCVTAVINHVTAGHVRGLAGERPEGAFDRSPTPSTNARKGHRY